MNSKSCKDLSSRSRHRPRAYDSRASPAARSHRGRNGTRLGCVKGALYRSLAKRRLLVNRKCVTLFHREQCEFTIRNHVRATPPRTGALLDEKHLYARSTGGNQDVSRFKRHLILAYAICA
ncbi:hypothetical protein EVAR_30046_1 [Eumeta japonica]|uniref:Uncharacterized protein n=1 Tax=Eumeta variegata TaxID=151549 RepID=A0A4C1VUL5_EUMVA|nr:hypothetical protein EVAR_30046_1 [Eumeta japonica]